MFDKLKAWLKKARATVVASVLAIAAALGLYTVEAQTVTDTLTWTAPTTRIDGSALAASDIAKYTITWGTAPGGPYSAGTQDATVTNATVQRSGTGLGTRCYVVTVTDKAGLISAPSNEACKTVNAAPSPASNLKAG